MTKKQRAEVVLGDPKTKETFLTSTGIELVLKPISPLLRDKVIASVVWPKPPTYQAETVSGEIEEHEHNATTLETDEDKAAWAAYLAAMARAELESSARVAEMMFRRGIDYEAIQLPEDDGWIHDQEEMGVGVPEEPLKRKRHYMETELVSSSDELKMLTLRLMAMGGGISEEVLAQVEASFRNTMESETPPDTEDLEGAMELRDELPEGEDRTGVEQEP